MTKRWRADNHFPVIYGVFLRRIVDLDLLSPGADTTKLLAQVAALFAGASFLFTAPLILFGGGLPIENLRTMEHVLLATSMLVVGVLSLLAWESAFPERLDILILGPLPVSTRVVFLAKLSALLGAQGLSVLALNSFTGLVWPFLFAPRDGGPGGDLRSLVAYWASILAAVTFTSCAFLAIQGLLSLLLPRQLFLRSAVWLQALGFAALVALFILEPSLEAPEALASASNQRLLSALPTYWFFGLFQHLNGTDFPGTASLVRRAWTALAVSTSAAFLVVVLGYLRMLRRIVEQADIGPGSNRLSRFLQSRAGVSGAILLFSMLTLARSRKHRVLLAFYWGAGTALIYAVTSPFFPDSGVATNQLGPTEGYITASLLVVGLAVGALRMLLALPVAARANWLFRMTEFDPLSVYRQASGSFLLGAGLLPGWLLLSAIALLRWPGLRSVAFSFLLPIMGWMGTKSSMARFRKIPFACSYRPGTGNVHLIFWGAMFLLLPVAHAAASGFHRGLKTPKGVLILSLVSIGGFGICSWWFSGDTAAEDSLLFDEEPSDDLLSLGLK